MAPWKGQPACHSFCWPVNVSHCYLSCRTCEVRIQLCFLGILPPTNLIWAKTKYANSCCCIFRLRRIDAVASVLWFFILCLYLAESYFTGSLDWMDRAKLGAISLCCLVSFAAAVATRKPLGPRRARYRRSEFQQ